MAITPIDALPTAPSRTKPDTFSADGDAYFYALQAKFAPQMNAAITAMNTAQSATDSGAASALVAAQNAVAAVTAAQAAANAVPWVSGTTYQQNQAVVSQVNFQTYRKRTTASSSTTDPANDQTNWQLLMGNDGNGAFIPVAMSSVDIDLSRGNYFTHTANGTVTYNIINCPSPGYSFTLETTLTSGSVAFPASVKTPGDAAPTLNTGKTHLFMLVTSNTGARWRMTVAPNYTT